MAVLNSGGLLVAPFDDRVTGHRRDGERGQHVIRQLRINLSLQLLQGAYCVFVKMDGYGSRCGHSLMVSTKYWIQSQYSDDHQIGQPGAFPVVSAGISRSEERRVGKECGCRWSTYESI